MGTLGRQKLKDKERVVIKIGSSSLIHPYSGDINLQKIEKLVWIINDLKGEGKNAILASSDAIATGRQTLHRPKSTSLTQKQAFAAVRQARLVMVCQKLFAEHSRYVVQILMTKSAMINDSSRYNAQNTFDELSKLGAAPAANENNIVSTSEIPCVDNLGDSDRLSAIVAALVGVDLLVLLSDIDRLYTNDPRKNQNARFISVAPEATPEFLSIDKETFGSDMDTGGMVAELATARIATDSGSDMVIANGKDVGVIYQIMAEGEKGTLLMVYDNLNFDLMYYIYNKYQDNQ